MPRRISSIFQGAAGGAGTGFAIGGPWGAVAGGATGALLSLLEKTPEEEREERIDELRRKLERTRFEGIGRILKNTRGQVEAERQAAIERAAAGGRGSQAESFIVPAVGRVARSGQEALSSYQSAMDQAELGLESDIAQRPIEPNITDYLGELGSQAMQYKLGQDYIKTQEMPPTAPGGTASDMASEIKGDVATDLGDVLTDRYMQEQENPFMRARRKIRRQRFRPNAYENPFGYGGR